MPYYVFDSQRHGMAARGFQESRVGDFIPQQVILGIEPNFVHGFVSRIEGFDIGADVEASGDRRVGLNELERATSA
jgi:hypothetical protein